MDRVGWFSGLVEEDPGLDWHVGVGCATGEDEAEFRADYVEGVDLACGSERELTDRLSQGASGDLAHVAAYGHGYCSVRPLNDFDVDLVVGGDVEDAAHEYLAEGIGFEGLEVGVEFGGRHDRYLLIVGIGASGECSPKGLASAKMRSKNDYCGGESGKRTADIVLHEGAHLS